MKKMVYICAPIPEGPDESIAQLKRYTRYVLQCGAAPVAPHFYQLCMPENTKDRKEAIRSASRSLMWNCDEVWVFGNERTENMAAELDFCKTLNLKTRKIPESLVRKGIKP